MKIILKLLLIWALLVSVLLSPISVGRFVAGCETLCAADEYVREKVKMDSMRVSSPLSMKGGKSSAVYDVYIHGLDRQLMIATHERNPFYQSEDSDARHFTGYSQEHQDSIWIWYHPEGELRYARVDRPEFPRREEWVNVIVNGAMVAMALCALFGLVCYLIRKKKKKQA